MINSIKNTLGAFKNIAIDVASDANNGLEKIKESISMEDFKNQLNLHLLQIETVLSGMDAVLRDLEKRVKQLENQQKMRNPNE